MLGYEGKRVLVVGGATGMGAAAAKRAKELGATVIVMDVADVSFPVDQTIKVDLRDQASVDAALAQVKGPIHALFSCAGVADGTRGIMLINFISQRYITEKLVETGVLVPGSAVGMISSVAGLGWEGQLDRIREFLAIPDWAGQDKWVQANKSDDWTTNADGYGFSKKAMCAYVALQAFPLLKKGVRINSILPGPTDTPLARANADVWLAFGQDYRNAANVKHLQPEEMGDVVVFLCSPAASGINGINLLVDQGQIASMGVGSFKPA